MALNVKKSPNFVSGGVGFRKTKSVQPLDPSGVSGLVAWYKADSLALSNGATVTSWPDDSPNNNDLDNYENTPIYNSSDALLNGMPSVTYFGNSSNYKSNPTGLPVGSAASTTYVVGYWSGASSTADMFTWGSNAYTGARMGAGYYSGMIFENGGIATKQRPISANAPFIFSYPYVAGANTTAATTYLNGVAEFGEYPGLSGVPNISNPVAEIVIGRPATAPVERWTGAVAEVIVFNTTHSDSTREGIEKYLSNKYGVSVISSTVTTGSLSLMKIPPSIVSSGLVLYLDAGNPASYPGSGTTWTDLSGNGNTATLYGSPTYSSANGGSIDFGTSNSTATKYALVELNAGLRPSAALTEAVWAKLPSGAAGLRVFTSVQKGSGGTNSYALFTLSGNALYGLANTTGSDDYQTTGNVALNTWLYLVHTYDGANQRLYVNGVQLGAPWSTTGAQVYDLSNTKFAIGMNYDGPGYDAGISGNELGNLSVVQFYGRALSDAEIMYNFNVDKARFGL